MQLFLVFLRPNLLWEVTFPTGPLGHKSELQTQETMSAVTSAMLRGLRLASLSQLARATSHVAFCCPLQSALLGERSASSK